MTFYEQQKALSEDACRVFFTNVDCLRKAKGYTLEGLSREMKARGFRCSSAAIPIYCGRRGKGSSTGFFRASTFYLAAYAQFFGVSIPYLFSVDLQAEEEAKKRE